MEFTAQLTATGGNTTGIPVPAEVIGQLAAGRRPTVVVTVAGHTWRSSIAPMSGGLWIGVSAANRAAAGIAAGDELHVELEVDDAPRTVDVPTELAAALAADQDAQGAWDRLSYSQQRQHATAIEGAKAPETKQRRLDATLTSLRG